MPIIVDLYARVSTKEQAENGYSIQEQKERLTKYAEAQGWLINKLYSDEGFSGSNLNRAGIIAVMQDVESHLINKVVVFKLDRLSRSQKDTLHLIEDVFIPNGVDFVSMSESLDTGTSFGMAVIGMMACFAQLERATIQERMSIGRNASIKEGKFRSGNTVPLGYRYNANFKRLEIDEFEAALVRRIFDEYAAGVNAYQIYLKLHEDYPVLGNSFQLVTIQRMLNNPFYIGQQKWNGEYHQIEAFPQFIPDELYAKCSARLSTYKRDDKPVSSHQPSCLLCGITFCGYCGARLKFRKYNDTYRAICRTNISRFEHKSGERCCFKSRNVDQLEEAVLSQIKQIKISGTVPAQTSERTSRAAEMAKEIEALDKQISRLIDLYSLGTIEQSILTGKLSELSTKKDVLIAEHKKTQQPEDKLSSDELLRSLKSFDDIINNCSGTSDLIAVIRQLIRSITIMNDTMNIVWNF